MSLHKNRVQMTVTSVASAGVGTITLNAASSGYQSFSTAYAADATVDILITDGTTWEVARDCAYTNSGTTVGRGTLEASSTGSAVVFTSAAVVSVILPAEKGNTIEAMIHGYMSGLVGSWVSGTQLGCSAGSCYIESLGRVVYGAPATITPGSPSASTWYHVYAYSNAGVLTLEASTTAPVAFATPLGAARSKSGDTSRRYLYSALTTSGSAFRNFYTDASGLYVFKGIQPNASPFRVLSAGTATASTAISCSSVAPATAVSIIGSWIAVGGSGASYLTSGDLTPSSSNFIAGISGGQIQFGTVPCDTSQGLRYICTVAAPTTYLDVIGFNFAR